MIVMDDMWGRIQALMSDRRITHSKAAAAIGTNLNTFRGKMYRHAMLSATELYGLAILLDTTMEYLLVGRQTAAARYEAALRELESLAVSALEVIQESRH